MDNILEAIAGIVVSITLLDIVFRLLCIWNGDEALDRAIEESKPNPSRRRFDMKLLDVKALAVKWAASEARIAEARLELAAHFKAFATLTPKERETLRDEIEEQRALLESQRELIGLYRENDGETVAEITKELLKPSRN